MINSFTTDDIKRLADCNSCLMLGVLASDEIEYPFIGDDQLPITTMKNSNNIAFYIKPLSDEPKPILEMLDPNIKSTLYIGIDVYQSQAILPMIYRFTTDVEQKKQMIQEKFKGKLLLFRPKINFKTKEARDKVFKNVEIIAIESDIEVSSDIEYITIPKINTTNAIFEQRLMDGSNIVLDDFTHLMLDPEYILCGNYIYANFHKWERNQTNNKMWVCRNWEKIRRLKINIDDKELKNQIIRGSDNLVFIDRNFLNKHVDAILGKEGEDISVPVKQETLNLITTSNSFKNKEDYSEYNFLMALKEFTARVFNVR